MHHSPPLFVSGRYYAVRRNFCTYFVVQRNHVQVVLTHHERIVPLLPCQWFCSSQDIFAESDGRALCLLWNEVNTHGYQLWWQENVELLWGTKKHESKMELSPKYFPVAGLFWWTLFDFSKHNNWNLLDWILSCLILALFWNHIIEMYSFYLVVYEEFGIAFKNTRAKMLVYSSRSNYSLKKLKKMLFLPIKPSSIWWKISTFLLREIFNNLGITILGHIFLFFYVKLMYVLSPWCVARCDDKFLYVCALFVACGMWKRKVKTRMRQFINEMKLYHE